jgi:hypothetical protein
MLCWRETRQWKAHSHLFNLTLTHVLYRLVLSKWILFARRRLINVIDCLIRSSLPQERIAEPYQNGSRVSTTCSRPVDCNTEYIIINPASANSTSSFGQFPLSSRNFRYDVDAPPGLSLAFSYLKLLLKLREITISSRLTNKMLLNLPSELLRATLEYVRKPSKSSIFAVLDPE